MALYDGPIVDAHHHLWTYRSGSHPWLAGEPKLARSIGPADYRSAAQGLPIVGSVFVEALAADPIAELGDAQGFHHDDPGLCNALIGHVPLDAEDIEARLDAMLAAAPTLRGIRDIVAVRADGSTLARRPDLLQSPAFAAGLRALAARGLVFELMAEAAQIPEALALIAKVPGLRVVIEHAGSPDFSSAAGTSLWRDAMRAAAGLPGVSLKISALHCRMPDWTDERLAEPILALVGWFGVDRLAFASDFPTHDTHAPFRRAYESFSLATIALPISEQRALFCDTARRIYGM